jgi:hypothetical protein
LTCLGIASCSSGPKTYPVKGRVILDHGKPLSGGTVLFQSVANPEIKASGELDADGTFELGSSLGTMGTVAGEHQILILPLESEDAQVSRRGIPLRYKRFESSGLRFAVQPGENFCEIKLERQR